MWPYAQPKPCWLISLSHELPSKHDYRALPHELAQSDALVFGIRADDQSPQPCLRAAPRPSRSYRFALHGKWTCRVSAWEHLMNSQDTSIGCMVVQSVWIGCLLPPNGCNLPSCAFRNARQLPNQRHHSCSAAGRCQPEDGDLITCSMLELPAAEPSR